MQHDNRRPFASTFEMWLYQLDWRLLWYVGLTSAELPIKREAWRLLWQRGWGVYSIADALAGWMYDIAA